MNVIKCPTSQSPHSPPATSTLPHSVPTCPVSSWLPQEGRGGEGRRPSHHPCSHVHVHVHVHVRESDGTYGVILRIVRAGCHLVAIAQVVEH